MSKSIARCLGSGGMDLAAPPIRAPTLDFHLRIPVTLLLCYIIFYSLKVVYFFVCNQMFGVHLTIKKKITIIGFLFLKLLYNNIVYILVVVSFINTLNVFQIIILSFHALGWIFFAYLI